MHGHDRRAATGRCSSRVGDPGRERDHRSQPPRGRSPAHQSRAPTALPAHGSRAPAVPSRRPAAAHAGRAGPLGRRRGGRRSLPARRRARLRRRRGASSDARAFGGGAAGRVDLWRVAQAFHWSCPTPAWAPSGISTTKTSCARPVPGTGPDGSGQVLGCCVPTQGRRRDPADHRLGQAPTREESV